MTRGGWVLPRSAMSAELRSWDLHVFLLAGVCRGEVYAKSTPVPCL